jgi:hypothetical protein
MSLKGLQRHFERILPGIKTIEDEVVEMLFTPFVPHLFDGIEFGRRGRQG